MDTSSVFDSKDSSCKTPYGAVPCGTEVHFTLRPPRSEGFCSCTLVAVHEFANQRQEILLPFLPDEGDRSVFSGTFQAPVEPELVWYYFQFRHFDGGTVCLGRDGLSREEPRRLWQQTVYDASLPTPKWFGQGVTYQIFPDRFRRTGTPSVEGLVGSRVLHQSWDEPVELNEDQGDDQGRDFFGGTLAGIEEKLEYLKNLGVTTLYLCPIFEAESNHRYNTADYEAVDPLLGTEADFRSLCARAHALGMRVMLDGVFNHTGSNSRYFNANGFYPDPGAAQSRESPYFSWYTFQSWPDKYDAWWGVRTLPAVNEEHPEYGNFIVDGECSVIRRWLRAGADAWRLDVADELPDEFIARIRAAMAEEKPDSFLLGEVWEDGSNKVAYDRRRKYLLGSETHGLMNYPFRTAALSYLLGRSEDASPYGAEDFREAMETIRENYPRPAFYSAMNLLGTHDTPRILTLLGGPETPPATRRERAAFRLSPEARVRGLRRVRMAALLLYAFPGSPTVFYGDEAGMEGWEDPMNRGTFPWGREDRELQAHFLRLGTLRRQRPSLQSGELRWLYAEGPLLAFARELEGETSTAVFNTGTSPVCLELPWDAPSANDILTGGKFPSVDGKLFVAVPPEHGMLLI